MNLRTAFVSLLALALVAWFLRHANIADVWTQVRHARMDLLILGFIMRYALSTPSVSVELRVLLTTGFCGGYTTFSTFGQETLDLIEARDGVGAVLYATGSVAIGVLAVLAGARLARLV